MSVEKKFGDLWQTGRYFANTVIHELITLVTIYCCWFACEKLEKGPLLKHIVLCTVGALMCCTESILLFSPDNVWSKPASRKTKVFLHAFFLLLGTALAIAGIVIEIDDKNDKSATHFKSKHAITGLAAMILWLIGCLTGFLANYAQSFSQLIKPVFTKMFHNILSIVALLVGLASLCYAYNMYPFKVFDGYPGNASGTIRDTLVAATCIVAVYCCLNPLLSLFNQLKTILDK